MSNLQVIKFSLQPGHTDFKLAYQLCEESRVFYNAVNTCLRARYFHKSTKEYADHIYHIPQQYDINVDNDGAWYSYNWVWENIAKTVRNSLKNKHKIKLLTVKQQQQIIRKLCNNWTSYWGLWKLYKKGELKDAPNIPHYKETFNGIDFTNQMINKSLVKKGVFKLSGLSQGFTIPEYLDKTTVKSGRLVVNNAKSFTVELLYEVENIYTTASEEVPVIPEDMLVAAIDPGVDNLFTIVFSDYREALLVDGKQLKHTNNRINSTISKIQSAHDVERNNLMLKTGNTKLPHIQSQRVDALWEYRDRVLYHDYTTITNEVVRTLCSTGVECVVLGYNQGIKQRANMGRKNNRNFAYIPIKKILDNLAWKLSKAGIMVVWTEESYTSQASFIDNDPLPVYGDDTVKTFTGYRKHRGLYVSKHGGVIHADVNGGYNIMRKIVPWFCSKETRTMVRDSVVYPARRVRIISLTV